VSVRVGVLLPSFRDSPADALEVAIEAERRGIDGVFVYDHLWPMGRPDRPALAPFPLLGAVAARTTTVHLGTLVARIGLVPDETLAAEFGALAALAPGRVVAGLGTGDHLSFNENRAYGVTIEAADERRGDVEGTARALLAQGVTVWVGGRSRPTVEAALAAGAVPNFWQAPPEEVAAQAAQSEVTWAGMAGPADQSAGLAAAAIAAAARPVVEAGASWVVFGWPLDLTELAAAARTLRSS
jgi:alkanesulfonate monooxygenase SsuD/methylene tetrahydromethanopterin reductase-like flavin-dependent oxidoreductase (luciferase family)